MPDQTTPTQEQPETVDFNDGTAQGATLTELEKPAPSWIWMKDSAGHPSITVTFVAISFWITTAAYVLSMFSKIGPLEIRTFDVGACAAYFGICLSTYVARRATEAKWGNPNHPPHPGGQ